MRRVLMLLGAVWPPIYLLFFVGLVVEATIRNGGDPDNDLLVPFGQNVCQPVSPCCSRCKLTEYCARVGVTRSR